MPHRRLRESALSKELPFGCVPSPLSTCHHFHSFSAGQSPLLPAVGPTFFSAHFCAFFLAFTKVQGLPHRSLDGFCLCSVVKSFQFATPSRLRPPGAWHQGGVHQRGAHVPHRPGNAGRHAGRPPGGAAPPVAVRGPRFPPDAGQLL